MNWRVTAVYTPSSVAREVSGFSRPSASSATAIANATSTVRCRRLRIPVWEAIDARFVILASVNAFRMLMSLGSFDFASPQPVTGGTVSRTHVEDLRNGLPARTALGLSSTFTDSTLTTSTLIKAVHLTELRSGVQ